MDYEPPIGVTHDGLRREKQVAGSSSCMSERRVLADAKVREASMDANRFK
jgi:hypothetical protein